MSLEERKLQTPDPEEDLGRPLTPQEEMKRRQDEFNAIQNFELRVSLGEVTIEPVLDKNTGKEIGIQYIDKKTGEILFWENTKKINSELNRRDGMEEI